MTAKPSQMERIQQLVSGLCAPVELGTDMKYTKRRIELALRRADEWVADAQPPKGGIRGGSTSPQVAEEQSEDRAVSRMALSARTEIVARMSEAEKALRALERLVVRFTATVDASKLPPDPGNYCVNCMTIDVFSEVCVNAPKSGLCRWCYDRKRIHGFLPPADVLRTRATKTSQAANKEMAEVARLRAKGAA